jgi:hypothetical protein
MSPLIVPDTLPEYTRGYLRLLDDAITKTVRDATVTSDSYRRAAQLYRDIGKAWEATGADDIADRIELDPRLHVAGIMHKSTPDGTAKLMLFTYINLLEEQARASRAEKKFVRKGIANIEAQVRKLYPRIA